MQENTLHFIDEGHGSTIVFVHGTPSSSLEFRAVIDELKKNYRCIAIDHLGFGKSQKPVDGDYSLQAHSQRLNLLLKHLGVRSYHLVVTDFGGAIALPVAIEHWEQIQSLTVINTWAWPLAEVEPNLAKMKFLMTSGLMKFLYLKMNFSANVMVKSAWGTYRKLTRAKHGEYKSMFRSARERHGTWEFVNALFDPHQPAWNTGKMLRNLETKPSLILWGDGDKFISKANLEKWSEILPKAKVHILPKVGHFVCDEAPELVIPILKDFYRSI